MQRSCRSSCHGEQHLPENHGASLVDITVRPTDDKVGFRYQNYRWCRTADPDGGPITKKLSWRVGERSGESRRGNRQIESKLANEAFVARAPEAVIAQERERLVAFADAKTKLIVSTGGYRCP
ncbi:hypothetical protein ACNKHS_25065 [Shigella flexneri]